MFFHFDFHGRTQNHTVTHAVKPHRVRRGEDHDRGRQTLVVPSERTKTSETDVSSRVGPFEQMS